MTDQVSVNSGPRVCLCVMMNHPFPANIPVLREIYAGRFTYIRFLIPFERLEDHDVITVYRGSYVHAAYLTDARRELEDLECDFYVVVHDDVLLNPRLSEATFIETFRLGPDDGFIPEVSSAPTEIAENSWYFGMVPKLAFPKSTLFGTGIEKQTLAQQLPDPGKLAATLNEAGIQAATTVRVRSDGISAAGLGGSPPSHPVLFGLAGPCHTNPQVELDCAEAAISLVRAMQGADRAATAQIDNDRLTLPLPLITGFYYTDFYILPKSGFSDFCHYMGVAGAANLFVEFTAPTILHACCRRVVTAADAGLCFSFDLQRPLSWFSDSRNVALHPCKLSEFRKPGWRAALVEAYRRLQQDRPIGPDNILANASFGRWTAGFIGRGEGWHDPEHWGLWASTSRAKLPIQLATPGDARLTFRAPGIVGCPPMTGHVRTLDGRTFPISPGEEGLDVTIFINDLKVDDDGFAWVEVITDTLIRPCDHDRHSADTRALGLGIARVETL